MRIGDTGKDCVLLVYAVLENVEFKILSVGIGNTESTRTWEDLIVDLKKRGLKDSMLCLSDGNMGLCSNRQSKR